MTQAFKTIYFSDHAASAQRKRTVTLAFGPKDQQLHADVCSLSSHELREFLGHSTFVSLQTAAASEGLAVNTYCLRQLRERRQATSHPRSQPLFPGFAEEKLLPIDPIQATYRGGKTQPFHDWFPFLEGYSPDFVERLLTQFAPEASNIIDPFSGSGTTPLTIARLGRQAYFCELNPVLQFLAETKVQVFAASPKRREQAIAILQSVSSKLTQALKGELPDMQLDSAYRTVFSDSIFFRPKIYEQILRARTVFDQLTCIDALASSLFAIAVLASLVPASLLIRRGDLRFKTREELARPSPNFASLVEERLALIVQDIPRLATLIHPPILLCEDARSLEKIPSVNADAVITSPPYLNGTNYFRNTKLELWFLRCLTTRADLAAYRFRTVTAGINDVTIGKPNGFYFEGVEQIVKRLEAKAYDSRIPLMVHNYFSDMKTVLSALAPHLTDNAPILIDIGDSAYGGVHVPTPALLAEMFQSQGYNLDREITLRQRMSRSGFPLSQILLVFRRRKPTRRMQERTTAKWHKSWQAFKTDLPHQQGDFAKRNWGHPLHSLCSYQGKMKPSLASYLLRIFVPRGGKMLDPFGGVGTIPFEAALQGVHAYTFDISPAALQIAFAKLGRPQRGECDQLIKKLDDFICSHLTDRSVLDQGAAKIRFNGPLVDYFAPKTFREILLARRFFRDRPPQTVSQSLVFACLLHILHGNRPYALSRRSHPITPFSPTGTAEYRALISRLRDKVERSLDVIYPDEFVAGKALFQDATAWWPQEVADLDAIITSPPFFDSTRFFLANWMRLWFAGWEAEDFQSKPLAFVDERQKKAFSVYESVFRQARERLKPGGVMVLHLGKSRKCDMAKELITIASPWFRVADAFDECVGHCESHGIRDKGTVEHHSYLVLH